MKLIHTNNLSDQISYTSVSIVDTNCDKKEVHANSLILNNEQFIFKFATTKWDLHSCYELRHLVYCEEKGYERRSMAGLEFDEFDDSSIHCMVIEQRTMQLAATARIITSECSNGELPVEYMGNYGSHIRIKEQIAKNRKLTCEFSRMAIHPEYRRPLRRDQTENDSIIDSNDYLLHALVTFMFSTAEKFGFSTVFMATEPKVARFVSMFGVPLEVMSSPFFFKGTRRIYSLSIENVRSTLPHKAIQLKSQLDGVIHKFLQYSSVCFRSQCQFNHSLRKLDIIANAVT